jgi:molybdopterin synthase catalytic subunit
MAVLLCDAPFDPALELARFQASLPVGSFGATASFVGTMRHLNDGEEVTAMTLEHYPGMTEKQLHEVISDACRQWDIIDALIVHRVGDILPGNPIVLTAVCSAHRAAAFDACRFLMEALKSRATFWKKETLASGEARWVEKNTPCGHATERNDTGQ